MRDVASESTFQRLATTFGALALRNARTRLPDVAFPLRSPTPEEHAESTASRQDRNKSRFSVEDSSTADSPALGPPGASSSAPPSTYSTPCPAKWNTFASG